MQVKTKVSKVVVEGGRHSEKRRGGRMNSRVPVRLEWDDQAVAGRGKTEICGALARTVHSNGGLIRHPESLAQGTKVTVEKVKTQNAVEAPVVRPPQFGPDGPMIPVEFAAVSPNFWNIFFPPVLN